MAIMISIQPQWVDKIINGEKTIEIRKTMPKCELPCRVYIYCTKGKTTIEYIERKGEPDWFGNIAKKTLIVTRPKYKNKLGEKLGKVVAEFILNKVEEFEFELWDNKTYESVGKVYYDEDTGEREVDVFESNDEINSIKLLKDSCLTVSQLREYLGKGFSTCFAWYIENLKVYNTTKDLNEFVCRKRLSKPPQSWCYVEEL